MLNGLIEVWIVNTWALFHSLSWKKNKKYSTMYHSIEQRSCPLCHKVIIFNKLMPFVRVWWWFYNGVERCGCLVDAKVTGFLGSHNREWRRGGINFNFIYWLFFGWVELVWILDLELDLHSDWHNNNFNPLLVWAPIRRRFNLSSLFPDWSLEFMVT